MFVFFFEPISSFQKLHWGLLQAFRWQNNLAQMEVGAMVALLQVVKGHHHHHHQDLSGCPEVFLALLPQPLQAFFFSCVCLFFLSFSLYRLCHLIILFLLLLLTFLFLLLHLCLQEGALYTRAAQVSPCPWLVSKI